MTHEIQPLIPLKKLSEEDQLRIYKELLNYKPKTQLNHIAPYTLDALAEAILFCGKISGVSLAQIKDTFNFIVKDEEGIKCINPFIVFDRLNKGMQNLSDQFQLSRTREDFEKKYFQIAKEHVWLAVIGNEKDLTELCNEYITNARAYILDEKSSENLMREIEEKINIVEAHKTTFRLDILANIYCLTSKGEKFCYFSNDLLKPALYKYLGYKKRESLVLNEIHNDRDKQEQGIFIGGVKSRLIKDFNYCETCSADVLNYVAMKIAMGA